MDEEEIRLAEEAFKFIKTNKKELIEKFASPNTYRPATNPIALFMAGSPGAGKTEVSKNLIKRFENIPIRIDADEIRTICDGYKGSNAHIFQKAANKGVNILFDHVLSKNLNFILDGTFAYGGAQENIERSIKYRRKVNLWFVYQDPKSAWEVTKAREIVESRHVSKEVFIRAFFESKINAVKVKNMFGKDVKLNLLIKDYETKKEELRLNISAEELDSRIGNSYTEEDLKRLLL